MYLHKLISKVSSLMLQLKCYTQDNALAYSQWVLRQPA